MNGKGRGSNPKSRANLERGKFKNREQAERARLKGLETRRFNKEIAEFYALAIQAMRDVGMDELPALAILRMQLMLAMVADDMPRIARLAELIAPFETPKAKAIEVKLTNDLSDKTDTELKALAEEMGLVIDDCWDDKDSD